MQEGTSTDVFISYSSKDKELASRLETDLLRANVNVWIDRANLRGGGLLLDGLQEAISRARALAVLWSSFAADSRYVKAEWQAAFHLEKDIIPCRLDNTDLPPFLLRYISCDFRRLYYEGLAKLKEALWNKDIQRPEPAALHKQRDLDKQKLVSAIYQGQNVVLNSLFQRNLQKAGQMQQELDSAIDLALRMGAEDPLILNLAGYQKKNAYMIKHWDEIQARQSPPDGLLEEAEKFFFASLSIQPDDPSALNGLGSVLIMRRDLDAAEFYIRRALVQARKQKIDYSAAEYDLRTILRLKAEGD